MRSFFFVEFLKNDFYFSIYQVNVNQNEIVNEYYYIPNFNLFVCMKERKFVGRC